MAKVILTESQLKTLLTEERLAFLLQESADPDSLVRKIKTYLAAGVSAFAILTAITNSTIPRMTKEYIMSHVKELRDHAKDVEIPQIDTTGFADKVKDVTKYMEKALANQGYTMNSTRLKPETLVSASFETGFDLPFLLAAAHQESCFGATPRAQRTNSVFSVGSYDNGTNTKVYSDPNDSVLDYIDLLKRRYLVNGKTIFDLLKPGAFVNNIGKRYASDMNYENKIRKLRNSIIKKCPSLA